MNEIDFLLTHLAKKLTSAGAGHLDLVLSVECDQSLNVIRKGCCRDFAIE